MFYIVNVCSSNENRLIKKVATCKIFLVEKVEPWIGDFRILIFVYLIAVLETTFWSNGHKNQIK